MRRLAALADRPHHQRLAAAHVAGGKDLVDRGAVIAGVGGDIAALVERQAEVLDHALVHRMHEAHRQQHELGVELEFAAGNGLHLVVDVHAVQLLDTKPLAPENRVVITAKSRSAPSSWLDEVRSFSGQFGQVSGLFSCTGGAREDFEIGDRQRALADRGADAVRAGIAAADDDDVLAGGEDRLGAAVRLAG